MMWSKSEIERSEFLKSAFPVKLRYLLLGALLVCMINIVQTSSDRGAKDGTPEVKKYRYDINQELKAGGFCTLFGATFGITALSGASRGSTDHWLGGISIALFA